jgi:hypothetical protein
LARALDLFRQSGDRDGEARTLARTGAAYERVGKSQDALTSYQAARALFLQLGEDSNAAKSTDAAIRRVQGNAPQGAPPPSPSPAPY